MNEYQFHVFEGARTTAAKSKKSVKTKKLVQPIPLDITGRPVFPIVLGGLTVHSIGEKTSFSLFEIASDNDMDMPITDTSANNCHSMLLQLINNSLGLEVVKTEGKGPEFFGFSNPTIQNLIQSSTGIRKCPGYKTMKFEVCKTGENLDLFENDASLNFDALQRNIAFSKQHLTSISIKEEPQDSINNALRDLLKTP
ncbi:hypothetical protein B566_EDAN002980 [Ephemera danica]|nr:hypothetical protein B566_EDAN002980 [Ephemera danica]